ncbi:hypothetical protein QYE73_22750 [Pseudomonas mosselii]|uniref:hypothetical protein n=1 Tax=Pseudomonas mosselii TaxID=78327 RepID=UPI002624718F|nr:hypothetical protein [Pseudomonas mosselii]MDN4500111.1 hypothetical protein [Pseudomonas mosselii]
MSTPEQDPMVAFEQTRAADLAAVYRALAALAEAPDLDTLHDRQDDVEHLLHDLLPSMISEAEFAAFGVQIEATALTCRRALGA